MTSSTRDGDGYNVSTATLARPGTTTTSTNQTLTRDNALPADEVPLPTDYDLTVVEGQIPHDLDGVYLRNTENPLHPALKYYHPFDGEIRVTDARNQSHGIELTKLPGAVTFTSEPPGATVVLGDETLGVTPTGPQPVAAGPVTVTFSHPRYQVLEVSAEVEGMDSREQVMIDLVMNQLDGTALSRGSSVPVRRRRAPQRFRRAPTRLPARYSTFFPKSVRRSTTCGGSSPSSPIGTAPSN